MDIPDLISSLDKVRRINDMQVHQEAYYNFVNSIDSDSTKKRTKKNQGNDRA